MNKQGDIIIVENDPDEWEILLEVFEQVMDEDGYDNRVIIFEESAMLIDFLKEGAKDPFMIISDINMPLMDGFELREQIHNDEELSARNIPFIFLTTTESESFMDRAKELNVNGYYVKPVKFEQYKKLIRDILGQWNQCKCEVEA